MINKLLKVTPLLGSILIFLGVLKLIFYYSHFGVSITDYLEFQEILTLFFADLNILVVFAIIMFTITFASIDLISRKYKVKTEELINVMDNYLYPRRFRYVIFFTLLAIILTILVLSEIINLNYLVIYIFVFSIIQAVTYLILKKNEQNEVYISDFSTLMISVIGLTFSIYLFALKDVKNIENADDSTKIVLDNNIINCGSKSHNMYIGKTKNYLFVKDKRNRSVLVLPIEKVEKIILK